MAPESGASRTLRGHGAGGQRRAWEPMPGLVKRECPAGRYRFAAAIETGALP